MQATPDQTGTAETGSRPACALSLAACAGLFAFALLVRLPTLTLHRLVEGDGVHYARLAEEILSGQLSGLANPYWSNLWPGAIAATAWLTGLDVVAAGRLASLAAGACLAPVTAWLAARVFGRVTGSVAGLLVAAHPWLVHFSTLVFTESLFALLLMLALLAATRAHLRTSAACGAGVLCGLAVVTRPEANALVVATLAWLAWNALRGASGSLRKPLLFLALVACFQGGRSWLIHEQIGVWDVGGTKAVTNLLIGLGATDGEKERISTELTPDGQKQLDESARRFSLVGLVRSQPDVVVAHLRGNSALLAAAVVRVFPQVPLAGGRPAPWQGRWPLPLLALACVALLLAAWGNLAGWLDARTRPPTALLTGAGLAHLIGLLPFLVHDRLVVALVPLFLVFLANGLVSCLSAVRRHAPFVRPASLPGAIAAQACLSLALLLRAPVLDYAGDPPVQREAGEWLRRHYAQDTRIMTASPSISYYFYSESNAGNDLGLPWADFPTLVALAARLHADLIVAPEWHLRSAGHPAAAALSDPQACAPQLRLVTRIGDLASGRVFVYALPAREAR